MTKKFFSYVLLVVIMAISFTSTVHPIYVLGQNILLGYLAARLHKDSRKGIVFIGLLVSGFLVTLSRLIGTFPGL